MQKRRGFIKKLIGLAASISGTAPASIKVLSKVQDEIDKNNKSKKPNILIVYTDQQALWSISAYKNKTAIPTEIHTPNIDSIAMEGVILDNYFTNSAVCTPSRGCFVSGLYPHNHGADINHKPMDLDKLVDGTWGNVLRREGYSTSWIGKWHLDGKSKPGFYIRNCGFGGRHWRWNRGHWKGILSVGEGIKTRIKNLSAAILGGEQYSSNWLTDRAIDYIDNHVEKNKKNPFALTISFPDPHPPYSIYSEYSSKYKGKVTVPHSLSKKNDKGRANWARTKVSKDRIKSVKEQYLAMVNCIDDNIGRLLDNLDKHGLKENTIVIFTTDHGDFMGEHGLTGKNKMYEPAFHIPFLIKWPKKIAKNRRVSEFVTSVDIKDTILDLAGIDINNSASEGKSAAKLLYENRDILEWDNTAYLHNGFQKSTGIVTEDWFMAHVKNRDSVLFNRKEDLAQVNNLAYDEKYANVMSSLTDKLYRHHLKVGTPTVNSWLENHL